MKRYLTLTLLLWCILSTFTVINTFAQQEKDFAEPSERRHNSFQPPEKIMDLIGLKTGMIIGDIGAGGGRFTVWFADRVGETGKAYANDIKKDYLDYLMERCEKNGFKNVIPCFGSADEPNIPEGVLDIAFMINVYHQLDNPVPLLKNIIPSLKPDGILTIVELDPKRSNWPFYKVPKEKVLNEAKQAGYELIKIDTSLPKDNIYFLRPKAAGNES